MGLGARVRAIELHRGLGRRVYRQGVAADLLFAATVPLFLVAGGDVLLTGIYGKVTTLIGGGATVLRFNHTPTGGAPVNMCAVSAAAITADAVNTLYFWDGTLAGTLDPLGVGVVGVGNAIQSLGTNYEIVVPGSIGLVVSVSALAGVIDWFMYYIPLDTDSVVTPQ